MLSLRKSVEYEADQLASKIMQKVQQTYPARKRDASFGDLHSERRTIKTLGALSGGRVVTD